MEFSRGNSQKTLLKVPAEFQKSTGRFTLCSETIEVAKFAEDWFALEVAPDAPRTSEASHTACRAPSSQHYTAIGPSVNLASRLQGLAVNNRVVASSAVYGPLGKRVRIANERYESIRGFAQPVKIADVLSLRAARSA